MADFGLGDLLNVGGTIWDYYNKKGNTQDISKNLSNAYSNATKTITGYQEPYQKAGLQALQGYQGLGPFDFNAQVFNQQKDPGYDFRLSEGLKGVERSQAAKGQYFSGQTLATLNTRAQNEASQEYQGAFNRALQSREMNQNYYGGLVNMGAQQAQSLGENLASLGLSRAGDMATLGQSKTDQFSKLLNDIGMVSGATGSNGLLQAADFISDKLFGTSVSSLADDQIGAVMDTLKSSGYDILKGMGMEDVAKSLGLGAAGLSGSADLLGQGIYGGLSGTFTDLGGGLIFDSATGAYMNIGSSAGAQGALTAGSSLQSVASFLSSAPGMGLTAAAISLLTGGGLKSAAVTGGLTYAGAAIGSAMLPGVGTVIGGILGGLGSSMLDMGGYAKADSTLTTIPASSYSGTGFKDKIYSEGPWGYTGFKSGGTRHLDVDQKYKRIFDYASGVDTVISGALTPEENQKMTAYLEANPSYGKSRNEGKVSPQSVLFRMLNARKQQLKTVLGDARYTELGIGEYYDSVKSALKSGGA